MISGIYKIENKINGKVYVGQSKDIHTRWGQHMASLSMNTHISNMLQKEWNKYSGDNFVFDILYETKRNVSKGIFDGIEQYFIELYDAIDNGYNTNNVIKFNKSSRSKIEKIVSQSYYDTFMRYLYDFEDSFGNVINYDKYLYKLINDKDLKINIYSTYNKIIRFTRLNIKYVLNENVTKITYNRIPKNTMCINFECEGRYDYSYYRVKQDEYRIDRLDKENKELLCIHKHTKRII